jgi:sugar lactone lactonase YvrE
MGHRPRFAALATAIACCACGDPFVVLGDAPGTFRIVAGIPDTVGSELGPTGTETSLDTPIGLAAGPDGLLYLADHGNGRILSLSSSGAVEVLIGPGDTSDPRLLAPEGIALAPTGESLFVTDPAGHRVWRIDLATGSAQPIAGNGQRGAGPDTADALLTSLETPSGIAAATDGTVYFTEFFAHRIRRLQDGTLTTIAGSRVPGFAGDSSPALLARLRDPAGLAYAEGILYVADSGNNRVRAIDLASGIIYTVAGSGSAGYAGDGAAARSALLNAPLAVAAAAAAPILYISDSGNHRIRTVSLDSGTISTFAGTGTTEFNGDLLAVGATALDLPGGLALSPLGLLFVSDTGHHIVRRTPVTLLLVP